MRHLHQLWYRLRGGELSALRLAASVAVGLFVGVLPLYGLHFALCLVICLAWRLDLVTAYLAANISIPPIAPFLLVAEVEMGALVVTGKAATFTVEQARQLGVTGYVGQAMVGAVTLGSGLALVGGLATWTIARRLRGSSRLSQGIERTVARYRAASRGDRAYVVMKLESDPVVSQLANRPDPLGKVVDAGAGRGQMSLLLLELGQATEVVGFDWDERKVALARKAAGTDADFVHASLESWSWPPADTVLLIDVLHYLDRDEQRRVLHFAAACLRPNGHLLIRDVDASSWWRSWMTRSAERLGARLGYNRARTLAFVPLSETLATLESLGLNARTVPAAAGTPLTNVLIEASQSTAD